MKKLSPRILWKKTKHSFTNIGSDADKDWRIILILFIVSVFVSVLWHIDLYLTMGDSKDMSSSKVQKSKTEVSEFVLGQMIDIYNKRADEFHIIENNKKTSVDPAQ